MTFTEEMIAYDNARTEARAALDHARQHWAAEKAVSRPCTADAMRWVLEQADNDYAVAEKFLTAWDLCASSGMALDPYWLIGQMGRQRRITRQILTTTPITFDPAPSRRAPSRRALTRLAPSRRAPSSQGVRLHVADGLRIDVENPDMGTSTELLDAPTSGPDTIVGLNVRYLLDVLNHTDAEHTSIELNQELDPVVVRPHVTDPSDLEHFGVIMPMWLS